MQHTFKCHSAHVFYTVYGKHFNIPTTCLITFYRHVKVLKNTVCVKNIKGLCLCVCGALLQQTVKKNSPVQVAPPAESVDLTQIELPILVHTLELSLCPPEGVQETSEVKEVVISSLGGRPRMLLFGHSSRRRSTVRFPVP